MYLPINGRNLNSVQVALNKSLFDGDALVLTVPQPVRQKHSLAVSADGTHAKHNGDDSGSLSISGVPSFRCPGAQGASVPKAVKRERWLVIRRSRNRHSVSV